MEMRVFIEPQQKASYAGQLAAGSRRALLYSRSPELITGCRSTIGRLELPDMNDHR
jgi:hypothetical protein